MADRRREAICTEAHLDMQRDINPTPFLIINVDTCRLPSVSIDWVSALPPFLAG